MGNPRTFRQRKTEKFDELEKLEKFNKHVKPRKCKVGKVQASWRSPRKLKFVRLGKLVEFNPHGRNPEILECSIKESSAPKLKLRLP